MISRVLNVLLGFWCIANGFWVYEHVVWLAWIAWIVGAVALVVALAETLVLAGEEP